MNQSNNGGVVGGGGNGDGSGGRNVPDLRAAIGAMVDGRQVGPGRDSGGSTVPTVSRGPNNQRNRMYNAQNE